MGNTWHKFVVVVLAVAIVSAAVDLADANAGPADAPADGDRLVAASVLADTSAVEPGKPFRVAVRLRMEPHWHVYWKNPGDSGVATAVEWHLPAGFSVGDLQWPAPQRFDLPGGIVNYGYENEVLLIATVTPPAKADAASVVIAAAASWLVCTEEQCLPGSAQASITLPIGTAGRGESTAAIEAWAARVPVPPKQSPDVTNVTAGHEGGAHAITIDWKRPAGKADWFPLPPEGVSYNDARVEHADARTVVRFNLHASGEKSPPAGSKSVLSYTNAEGEPRGLLLEF